MPSNESVRFTANGTSVSRNVSDIEKEVEGYKTALATSLAAAAGPVLELPNALNKCISEGRKDDAKKLGALTSLIGRDVDELLKQKTVIDQDYDRLIQNRPVKKKKLSDHYTDVLLTGSRYLALSQKAVDTVMKNVDEFADLVSPESKEASEA